MHIILLITQVYSFGSYCSSLPTNSLLLSENQTISHLKSSFFIRKKKHRKRAKIAIIGDQGLGKSSRNVLRMVKDWNAELLLIPGDFDYQDSPISFIHQITDVLGKDFPVIAAPGNHDILMWFGDGGSRYIYSLNKILLKQNITGLSAISSVSFIRGRIEYRCSLFK